MYAAGVRKTSTGCINFFFIFAFDFDYMSVSNDYLWEKRLDTIANNF